jgi:hypothetical protein
MAASRPRVLNNAGVVVVVPGVALQGRGRPHKTNSGGDGAPAGLMSWFDPADSRGKGSRVQPAPLRGRGALAVREWAAQCHGADTDHAAQFPAVAGMSSPRELAKQRRGVIPKCVMVRLCRVRALNARTRVREQVRLRGCLERGGGEPSSEAEPAQERREPSSEVKPARGRREPSSEEEPARGRRDPSSEAEPARGSCEPSSEAEPARGGL